MIKLNNTLISMQMSGIVRKYNFEHVRPAYCAVKSESSLGAFWKASDAKFLYAETED